MMIIETELPIIIARIASAKTIFSIDRSDNSDDSDD
jgi:hypothetical protein